MSKGAIEVEYPKLIGDCKIKTDFELVDTKPYNLIDMNSIYSVYGYPIKNCPNSILLIPAVANLSMVSWAIGFDLHIPVLEKHFHNSLKKIRKQFANWYPSFGDEGRIYVEEIQDAPSSEGSNSALFYSGGVDSLASYIRHRNEEPLLVAVHGADVKVGNIQGWDNIYSNLHAFASNEGVDICWIRSNFRQMINDNKLRAKINEELIGGWWGGIQHGLGIISLCAPLAHVNDIGTVYFASSYTDEFTHPWGSHPSIDNKIRWGKAQTIHDGYELSRQEKIRLISDEKSRLATENVTIRSCFDDPSHINCNLCEKCARTITGLILVGENPNEHGFSFDESVAKYIKTQISQGNWTFEEDEEFMWTDIQSKIPKQFESDIGGASALINWVADQDISQLREISNASDSRKPLRYRVSPYLRRVMPSKWYQRLQEFDRRIPF